MSDGHLIGNGPIIGGLPFTFGPTAVLRVARIEILIVSKRGQALDLEQFHAFGIDPATKATVGLMKSMQHFRAAFGPIAGQISVCDSGAISTPDLSPRRRRKFFS